MSLPVPTTIASGFADLAGSSYRVATDQLYAVDSGNLNVITVNPHSLTTAVVGTGYHGPSDIELSVNGLQAYITDSPGRLLRVNLTNLNHAAATVVASGMNGVDQVALDEAHGFAYVCEFTGGTIQQVNLTSGTKTTVATIASPRGVVVTNDGRFLYVSSDVGTVTRFDLVTNASLVVANIGPRHLTWADAGQSTIICPENTTGDVFKIDLTTSPATVTAIAGPCPFEPYSVSVLSSNQLLIASATAVSEVDLTSSVYSAAGPVLLGVGFVPADSAHIINGYADTTGDPTYFFQVKDCPFGGTLPLMINWQAAHSEGANFYQVYIHGPIGPNTQITEPFSDYLWSPTLDRFELTATMPVNGFYPLRMGGQIWLNYWLGLLYDTTGRPAGLNTISVRLFSARSLSSEIGSAADAGRSITLTIDNSVPMVNLQQIQQVPGGPVGTCGIVSSGVPHFTFTITATQPQSHLQAWSLVAYWGNNQSESVTSDSYSNHISATRLWAGVTGVTVPPPGPTPWDATVSGDSTSTHCAHSFFLNASDRVINGWGFVHGVVSYQQSITILL